jgi:hypothetical protein
MIVQGVFRLGTLNDVPSFRQCVRSLQLRIPCDLEVAQGVESPLAQPVVCGYIAIGNRIAIQSMEGWAGTPTGNPTETTVRRWQRFGRSGAKLIWGGEAVAVRHDGRANPNQLMISDNTRDGLARLREELIKEHRQTGGSDDGLLIGLQLKHSGRYCRPNSQGCLEPRILYHHPILDRRLKFPLTTLCLLTGRLARLLRTFTAPVRWPGN